jgi:hypothetical protein
MKWTSITLAFTTLLFATAASAQGERTAPKPAPELKQLDYFAGTWQTEAEMKPGPMGPGGKYTSSDTFKWQEGNFFLFGDAKFKSSVGDGAEFMVFGYDSAKKTYTYEAFTSSGEHQTAQGTLQGDTWTWTNGESGPFKWRYIEKVISPTSFAIKFEASQDGTNWSTIMEGKSKKL